MNPSTLWTAILNLRTTLAGPLGALGLYLMSTNPGSPWGHGVLAVALVLGFTFAADAGRLPPGPPSAPPGTPA